MRKLLLAILALALCCIAWGPMGLQIAGMGSSEVASGFIGENGTVAGVSVPAAWPYTDQGLASVFETETAGPVTYCHASTNGTAATSSLNIGIYNSDGSTLLRDGTQVSGLGEDGVIHVQLDSSYTLQESTSYALMVGLTTGESEDYWTMDTVSGTYIYEDSSWTVGDTLPSSATLGQKSQYYDLRIWCDGSATGD